MPTERASTLAELAEMLRDEAARFDNSTGAGAGQRWARLSAIRRLEGLSRRRGKADRTALLREVIRLLGGSVRLQRSAVPDLDDPGTMGRAGISIREHPDGSVVLQNRSMAVQSSAKSDVPGCLALDPSSRRYAPPATPDGVLLRHTRYSAYQSITQKAGLRAVLTMPEGATLLISVPTGGGKSLLFQLPVLHWRASTSTEAPVALVIVPTTSLVLSHLAHVRKMPGLEGCAAITADTPPAQRQDILERLRRGEVPILFLSPEMALAETELLETLATSVGRASWDRGRLAALFVDEAHIIESWGRSFRPDFQRLGGLARELRKRAPDLRCVLLSATISATARDVLRTQFGTETHLEIMAGVARREFDICVDQFESSDEREQTLLASIPLLPRPLVIYTTRVPDAERLGESLGRMGYNAHAVVTGETSGDERQAIVSAWLDDELDIVVATSAFGMGIDKPDVRCVVHACLPEDAARLYQEMGRAGRDGHQATTWLMYCAEDEQLALSQATGSWLRQETALQYWKALLDACRRSGGITPRGGKMELTLSLNARRPGVQEGSYVRSWNKALLVLLQRTGALEITGLSESKDEWRIVLNDPRLLERPERGFVEIYAARDAEQEHARRTFAKLKNALAHRDEFCLLAQLFSLVEDAAFSIDPCGRCPACRKEHVEPPTNVRWYGTDAYWLGIQSQSGLLRLMHPIDDEGRPGRNLAATLQHLKVDQFVVPDARALEWATAASAYPNCGLVVPASMLSDGWHLAGVPTAFVVSSLVQSAPEIHEVFELACSFHELTGFDAWVVAGPDLMHRGRPVDQVLSKLAPYHESQFEEMNAEERR